MKTLSIKAGLFNNRDMETTDIMFPWEKVAPVIDDIGMSSTNLTLGFTVELNGTDIKGIVQNFLDNGVDDDETICYEDIPTWMHELREFLDTTINNAWNEVKEVKRFGEI